MCVCVFWSADKEKRLKRKYKNYSFSYGIMPKEST